MTCSLALAVTLHLSKDLTDLFFELRRAFAGDSVFEWAYGLRCFAICLCEKGDLVSQWRGYAGGTGGFAIGFSPDVVAKTLAFHPESTAMGTTPSGEDSPEKCRAAPVSRSGTEPWTGTTSPQLSSRSSIWWWDLVQIKRDRSPRRESY
ncbi:DUF2971 domain-containing protein [Rhodococcus sp. ABRD24]|uniref:DUF2971 domain-containing protein n=1 Tax=Rhodococcus sp. ABRD24 TaxID=2507582 RepID=UPI00103DE1FC|nr:DUF2971 domain-containing protein [Rhodococcus sp. ABRD24]QBJ94655.1 DUF2971 domain-containing protein [Rhodococcus sp. ABRD24]